MSKQFHTSESDSSAAYEELKKYPRGIEILLKKAKVDPVFRALVLQDPRTAADSIELNLKENERMILDNTPKSVLKSMIQNTFVPKQHLKTFLTQKAPAMLALLLSSTVILNAGDANASGTMGVDAEEIIQYEMERATDNMAIIQSALEQYKTDRGEYPSTEQWLAETNPLESYVGTSGLFDPWKRKFHYEGVKDDSGKTVNYYLESLGLDPEFSEDNIPCPIEPELHRFPD
jgi:hypothetical protein